MKKVGKSKGEYFDLQIVKSLPPWSQFKAAGDISYDVSPLLFFNLSFQEKQKMQIRSVICHKTIRNPFWIRDADNDRCKNQSIIICHLSPDFRQSASPC